MIDDLALFQYYKGLGIGILIGIGLAWLTWRLPIHLRTRRTKKLRARIMDIKRIEAAFTANTWVPNTRELRLVQIPRRERISEWWQVQRAEWREATKPRTPRQVAEEAYQRALAEAL
jgi:hypothetical protein